MTAAVLGGLISYYQVRGPLRRAQELCERQLRIAMASGQTTQIINAQRRMGWSQFCGGRIASGRQQLHASLVQYRSQPPPAMGRLTETDTGVVGLANLGWAECFVGDMESGARLCAESVARARMLGSLPMDMSYALAMSAAAAQQRGRPAETLALAGEALQVANQNELPYWRAWTAVLAGWASSHDAPDEGLSRLKQGLQAYQATGARLFVPHSLALAAEVCLRLGLVDEGLALVQEGLSAGAEIDVHFVDAELLRLRGHLEWRRGGRLAAITLQQAATVAAQQGAAALQQRIESERVLLLSRVPDRAPCPGPRFV